MKQNRMKHMICSLPIYRKRQISTKLSSVAMCHNSMKKIQKIDTKDYSEQLEFLNSQPYYYPVVRFSGTPYRLVPSQKSTGCSRSSSWTVKAAAIAAVAVGGPYFSHA